jgi:hypothetical protein
VTLWFYLLLTLLSNYSIFNLGSYFTTKEIWSTQSRKVWQTKTSNCFIFFFFSNLDPLNFSLACLLWPGLSVLCWMESEGKWAYLSRSRI